MRKPSRIHRGLVGKRELVGAAYMADADLRREYQSEIAPRTMRALDHVLDELDVLPPGRVLDLGAGTGAVGAAVRRRWPGAEIVAVDKVGGPGIVRADVTRGTRPDGVSGRFDLLIAAHLLNELRLDPDDRARLVLRWSDALMADDGTLLLIEPALRQTSRDLLVVRDRLVSAGLFVVAPCLWQGPCPALSSERDFCHASAAAIAHGRSRVDFSYLAIRRRGTPETRTDLFRVVSDPIKDKGRLRLFGCGPAGRLLITRLDRDGSPSNRAFEAAARGDLILVRNATPSPGSLRCESGSVVERVRDATRPAALVEGTLAAADVIGEPPSDERS